MARLQPTLLLLVKAIWNLGAWNHYWKVLYGAKSIAQAIRLPYSYKTAALLKRIKVLLASRPDQVEFERLLDYSLQNTGAISRFVEFVAYKAQRLGKRVIQINEAYTTQI